LSKAYKVKVFLQKKNHSGQKMKIVVQAQKTSQMATFTIGIQQWTPGINPFLAGRERKQNEAILAKYKKIVWDPKPSRWLLLP